MAGFKITESHNWLHYMYFRPATGTGIRVELYYFGGKAPSLGG